MYNKLFSKILDSSIWLEPDQTRIVWMTLIASMDEDGFCPFACPANLANRAMVPLEKCEAAIKTLESADPNSADQDNDGRRLERVPGGWLVLNAGKYNELVSRQMKREGTRRRVADFRAKKREPKTAVTHGNAEKQKITQSDSYSDTVTTHSPRAREAAHGSTQVPGDSDTLILEVAKAHPRYLSPAVTQSAIANEAERLAETRFAGDARKALQFLVQRTLLYRKATMAWPEGEKKFICGSDRWYSEHKYDEDEALWEINHAGAGRDTGGRVSRAEARESANISAAERVIREEILAAEAGSDHGSGDTAGGGDQGVGKRRGPEDLRGHARGHAFRAAVGGFRTR